MAGHDRIQAIVDQSPVDHSVGLVPLFDGKIIDVVGKMCVAEILSVAREVFCRAGEARDRVGALQVSGAHVGDPLGIISERAGDDLCILPVIGDIADRGEGHIAADGRSLFVGHFSQRERIFFVSGGADLHAGADLRAVRAGAVSSCLCVAGDKYRDFRIFLKFTVLFLDHFSRSRVVTAAAQMIFFHQFFQVCFVVRSRQLKEKLSHFFLVAHAGDGFLYPLNVFVRQPVWVRFQIYHVCSPFPRRRYAESWLAVTGAQRSRSAIKNKMDAYNCQTNL